MSVVSHRRANQQDLSRLHEIYNGIICEGGFTADLQPQSLEQRQNWFDSHQMSPYLIYVVECDEQIVGYFYFSPWRSARAAVKKVAEVSYYLAPEARGKGLGKYMLDQVEQLARSGGIDYLLAILLESNSASRALLEKGGFKIAGLLPGIADLITHRCGQLIMYRVLQEGTE